MAVDDGRGSLRGVGAERHLHRNGTPFTAPDYWFASTVAGWRIYNLTAAWGQTLSTGNTPYAEDYARHWAPGAAERTWLTNDLAANPTVPKIAVFHFPLYSAVRTGDIADPFLTAPTDGSQSLEALLATNNVKLVLNGHSHVYERNNRPQRPHLHHQRRRRGEAQPGGQGHRGQVRAGLPGHRAAGRRVRPRLELLEQRGPGLQLTHPDVDRPGVPPRARHPRHGDGRRWRRWTRPVRSSTR